MSTAPAMRPPTAVPSGWGPEARRSEEHTSELQSLAYLVCRLLLEKKKTPRFIPTLNVTKRPSYYVADWKPPPLPAQNHDPAPANFDFTIEQSDLARSTNHDITTAR